MTTPLMEQMAEALEHSIVAVDDWLNIYASEFCGHERVAEAEARIAESGGTIAYIAWLQQSNRKALAAYRQQAAEPALRPVGDVVVLRRKRDGGVSRLSRIMDRPKDLESCLLHWRDTYTDELWDIEVCQIFSKSKGAVAAMGGEKADN